MKKKCCFVWPLRECFTKGTLIELGKCDFDITRPDTGAAQRLWLESVKQTKITVLRAIRRRICIIGEDFSPSLGIHEHGEIVSFNFYCLCYIRIMRFLLCKSLWADIHINVNVFVYYLSGGRFILKDILKNTYKEKFHMWNTIKRLFKNTTIISVFNEP